MDCLEAMKQMPDNAFDLAVVDPPYGDGSQVVQVEREREPAEMEQIRWAVRQVQDGSASTAGARTQTTRGTSICDHLHSSCRKREREREAVARTGGTWAEKYGKKL